MNKILVVLLICSILLAGCLSQENKTNYISTKPTVTGVSETQSPLGTHWSIATYTPWPTISSADLDRIAILLNDKNCTLPCYLGIVPGVTPLKDAMYILNIIGGTFMGNYHRESDNTNNYDYSLKIGFPYSGNDTSDPFITSTDIHHDVTLITNNEIVQIVEVSVSAAKSIPFLHEYWSRLFPAYIMNEMGKPESLYIGYQDPKMAWIGRSLVIDYKNQGVYIQLFGSEHENNLCFYKDSVRIDLILHLFDVDTTINVFTNGGVPYTDRISWVPIDDSLGISTQEFYSRVLADPTTCFIPLE